MSADDIRLAVFTRCGSCPEKPGWRRGPLYPSYGELVFCERCQGTGYVRSHLVSLQELASLLVSEAGMHRTAATPPSTSGIPGERDDAK